MDEDDLIEEEESGIDEDEGGGGDDAGWLTSYADLMTLVACFFILMMAFANYDPPTFQRKADLLAKYFKGEDESSDDPSRRLLMKIKSISNLEEITQIRTSEDGIELILNVKTLFRLGSAKLTIDAEEILKNIIKNVLADKHEYRIIVEGHTDNIPIKTKVYPSNWELSSGRATSVIRHFIKNGYSPQNLIALGYGETRPAYPNTDASGRPIPENQARNRRIIVNILHPSGTKVPLGFGVFFDR
jgi:chemotaxis protein MotB